MEAINEYLKSISIESLMELSSLSESNTFEENSIIRKLISDFRISPNFHVSLIGLRNYILIEITRRYFGKLK